MSRPSTVDRLPDEIREEIGRLRGAGHTLDEIMAALRQLDVSAISRSALGRHIKGMEHVGQKVRRSRDVAQALVRQLGDQPASRTAQLNIELVHSAILDLFLDQDGEASEAGREAKKGDPEGVMMLARAIQSLTSASKQDAEFSARIEERAAAKVKREIADGVDGLAKARGITRDSAELVKQMVFGVRPTPAGGATGAAP